VHLAKVGFFPCGSKVVIVAHPKKENPVWVLFYVFPGFFKEPMPTVNIATFGEAVYVPEKIDANLFIVSR
jgi:hypothetical protein